MIVKGVDLIYSSFRTRLMMIFNTRQLLYKKTLRSRYYIKINK